MTDALRIFDRIYGIVRMLSFFSHSETFERCPISFKIKAHENLKHRNILDISRIKIRMQRGDWADKRRLRKGAFCKGLTEYAGT